MGLVGDPSTDPSEQRGASSGYCYHGKGQSVMMETSGVSHRVRQGILQLRREGGKAAGLSRRGGERGPGGWATYAWVPRWQGALWRPEGRSGVWSPGRSEVAREVISALDILSVCPGRPWD